MEDEDDDSVRIRICESAGASLSVGASLCVIGNSLLLIIMIRNWSQCQYCGYTTNNENNSSNNAEDNIIAMVARIVIRIMIVILIIKINTDKYEQQ